MVDSLHDVWFLFKRANTKYLATPVLPFFSLFMPVVFLTLFTQLFSTSVGRAPGFPTGSSYLQFAIAGVLVLNVFETALQSGASIVEDLNSGYLSKMLVTPMNRAAIVLGRLLSDGLKMVLQASIILILGYLMGATVAAGALGIGLILLTVAVFGMAWSGVSLAVGLSTRSPEVVAALPMVLTLPLLFTSTALVPIGLLPQWMRSVSTLNPISYGTDAVRALISTGFSWNSILQVYGVTVLIALLTLGATLHQFRKVGGAK